MPQKRLDELCTAIETDAVSTIDGFNAEIEKIYDAYDIDEWLWGSKTYKEVFGLDLAKASKEDIFKAVQRFLTTKIKFLKIVVADVEKEFTEQSRTGFGQDGTAEDIKKDFEHIRGRLEDNKYIKQIKTTIVSLEKLKKIDLNDSEASCRLLAASGPQNYLTI